MNDRTKNNSSISYSRILEETRLKLALAREHFDTLESYGLTHEELDKLEAAANEAEQFPSYEYQQGQLRSLTEIKDKFLAEYVTWGRQLRTRMELAFSKGAAPTTPFPARAFGASHVCESKAIALFPTLLRVAEDNRKELATAGFQESDLETAEQIFENLKSANEAQEAYKVRSTAITQQRRLAYRALYERVQRIIKIGQAVYGYKTPNGQLFRSNWRRPAGASASSHVAAKTASEETAEVTEPELAKVSA